MLFIIKLCIGGVALIEEISLKSKDDLEPLAITMQIHLLEKYRMYNKINFIKEHGYSYVNIDKHCFAKAAEAFSEYIIENMVFFFILDVLDEYIYELPKSSTCIILEKIRSCKTSAEVTDIKREIRDRLIYFANEYNQINITGFLTFSINDCKEKLYVMLYNIISDFSAEESYREIIDYLNAYIETEPSSLEVLNIFIFENGRIKYYDKNYIDITDNWPLSEISMNESYCSDDFSTQGDNLLETLMRILPQQINIYVCSDETNERILTTIKAIFGRRVIISELDPL